MYICRPSIFPFSQKKDRIHGIDHLKGKITIISLYFIIVAAFSYSSSKSGRIVGVYDAERLVRIQNDILFLFFLSFFYLHNLLSFSFVGFSLPYLYFFLNL